MYSTLINIEKPDFSINVGKYDRSPGLEVEVESKHFVFWAGTTVVFCVLPYTKAAALKTRWVFDFQWGWWFYSLKIPFPQSK